MGGILGKPKAPKPPKPAAPPATPEDVESVSADEALRRRLSSAKGRAGTVLSPRGRDAGGGEKW